MEIQKIEDEFSIIEKQYNENIKIKLYRNNLDIQIPFESKRYLSGNALNAEKSLINEMLDYKISDYNIDFEFLRNDCFKNENIYFKKIYCSKDNG